LLVVGCVLFVMEIKYLIQILTNTSIRLMTMSRIPGIS